MSAPQLHPSNAAEAPAHYERHFVAAIGRPFAEDLVARAGLSPGERVLDVGCGTGIVARLAAAEVGESGEVAGVDPMPGMLGVARAVTPADYGIAWHQAGAEAMPLADDSFDVVLCQMSLMFVPDPKEALAEMARVLAPGGRLLVSVPGEPSAPFAELADALGRHVGPDARGFLLAVFSLGDEETLHSLLEEGGFDGVEVDRTRLDLELPPAREWLWQYVRSTPLVARLAEEEASTLDALERDVLAAWRAHERNGGMAAQQSLLVASARP